MKNKQLAINMIANIISFMVNIGINFLFTPYLINTVGKEAYSFFPLANNFISYTSIITVALNSMASRFITINIHQNKDEEVNKYFNSVLISNTIIALILMIPSIFIVLYLNNIFDIPIEILKEVQVLFGLIFFGTIISILSNVFGVATFAKNRLDLASRVNIESNIIKVILLVLLFKIFRPSVSYIGIVNLVVILYITYFNIKFTKKLLPSVKLNKKFFDIKCVKELLSSGVWNSINQLSVVLLTGLDLMIANIFIGVTASAEYSIVKVIPNFIQSLVAILVSVFIPQFTILYAKNQQKDLLSSINKSIKFMGLIITIPIGFLIVFGDVFYSLWVPGQDIGKLYLLSNLTIIPMIITGTINTIFNVYSITNKLKIPALVLLMTGVVNTLLVLALVTGTNMGILAIPLVSFVIGIARNFIFTPIYAAKCLKVNWKTFYKSIFKGVFCAIIMIICCFVIKRSFIINSWSKFIIAGVCSSIITLVINIISILNKEERLYLVDFVKKIRPRRKENV
ncbi:MAG: MATE family efflux transporter [Clostridium sp.]|uniref:MATE family efflux transporter n=1 Tax=Clostridium sp. TaxID=1506 RepID=UPI0029150F66|nr:MATE family efflux transporter [Clostridium sp.]MDU4937968.1 MATE family efflux transporter [Clostridium sp.]